MYSMREGRGGVGIECRDWLEGIQEGHGERTYMD